MTQDKLFITYRNRSKWQRKSWDPKAEQFIDLTTTPSPTTRCTMTCCDNLYVTSFLTAPARLTVQLGPAAQQFDLPAGVAHTRGSPFPRHAAVRADPGRRRARRSWPTSWAAGRSSARPRRRTARQRDAPAEPHLDRGVAVGPPIHLDAAAGSLHGHAACQDNAVATARKTPAASRFPSTAWRRPPTTSASPTATPPTPTPA